MRSPWNRWWWLAATVLIGGPGLPRSALCADRQPRIALSGTASPELRRKLRAEARAAGLTLVEDGASDATVAVLRTRGDGAVEIWLTNERGEAAERLCVLTDSTRSVQFPVRVVEELRARLVKLEVLPPTSSHADLESASKPPAAEKRPQMRSPEASPPASLPAQIGADAGAVLQGPAPSRTRRVLWTETGAAGTIASGGMGSTLHALVGLRLEPTSSLGIEAFALLPLTDNKVSEAEGTAEVQVNVFAGRVGYRLSRPASALSGEVGAGAGAVVLALQGEAVPPYAGRTDQVVLATVFLHGNVSYRFTDWLRLQGGPMLGVSAPRSVVEFRGRDVTAWGRVFGSLFVSLHFGIPTPMDEGGDR